MGRRHCLHGLVLLLFLFETAFAVSCHCRQKTTTGGVCNTALHRSQGSGVAMVMLHKAGVTKSGKRVTTYKKPQDNEDVGRQQRRLERDF